MKMTTENFSLKDSGQRQQFASGMVREPQEDKLRYDLAFDGPLFWAMFHGGKYDGVVRAAQDWYEYHGVQRAAKVIFELALITDGGLWAILDRYTVLMMKGALKYSEHNWLKAEGEAELNRFIASFCRHFAKYLREETDEDHLAAAFFNLNGAEYVLGKLAPKGPLAF